MSWFKRKDTKSIPSPEVDAPVAPKQAEAFKPKTQKDGKVSGLEAVRNIIAVGSGKGGVGKSTITLNLALALQQRGFKVGLLDADIYGPSQQHLTRAGKPELVDDDKMIPPLYEGVKLISIAMFAPSGQAQMLRGPMATQVLRQFLAQVEWGELDYLLIDLPPGTGDIQLSLAQMAPVSGAILVTTPQEISVLDVRKAVSMFKTVNIPILGVVENMSYFICDGCDKKHYIFQQGGGAKLAAEIGVPLLAEIPLEPKVAAMSDAGTAAILSLVDSEVGRSYGKVAEQISQQMSLQQRTADGALGYFLLEWK